METTRKPARFPERTHFLQTHRSWEDWVGIVLSLLIILSPWMARQAGDPGVVMVTTLIGLMLLTSAQYELVKTHRSVEVIELSCGLAVIALPVLLGYAGSGTLRVWHFGLGALVVMLAVLELWQSTRNAVSTALPNVVPSGQPQHQPMHGNIH